MGELVLKAITGGL